MEMSSMLGVIGLTPTVQLAKCLPDNHARVFVKLEMFNPTGSYKDRAALAMITAAEKRNELKEGMTVIEATAGSTGSSLAFVCACKGYKFKAITSNAYAEEKLRIMEAFGASLSMVHSPSGTITKELVPQLLSEAKNLARRDDVFYTDQFHNQDAVEGYAKMADEILHSFPSGIDAICASVGTAGMITGVVGRLRDKGFSPRVYIIEPSSSPALSSGSSNLKGHRIEGVAPGFRPPLLRDGIYEEVIVIEDEQAFQMARRLAKEEGILAGTSTGLNVAGAIEIASRLPPSATVLTVACDTGMKYMAGDLYKCVA